MIKALIMNNYSTFIIKIENVKYVYKKFINVVSIWIDISILVIFNLKIYYEL